MRAPVQKKRPRGGSGRVEVRQGEQPTGGGEQLVGGGGQATHGRDQPAGDGKHPLHGGERPTGGEQPFRGGERPTDGQQPFRGGEQPFRGGEQPTSGQQPLRGGERPTRRKQPRPKRVRNRLVASVAAVAVLVLAAGAPAVVTASDELARSQRLLDLSQLNRQALSLAHSLADERDEETTLAASATDATGSTPANGDAGGSAGGDQGAARGDRTARVDRQIAELTADGAAGVPASVRGALAKIPALRRDAAGTKVAPLDLHKAYSSVIDEIRGLSRELAHKTPPRAGGSGTAPATLGNAVEQAAAARGLLVGALAVPRGETRVELDPATGLFVRRESGDGKQTRDALSAAAQQTRVREKAALADFDLAAPDKDRSSFAATVSGPEVKTAEQYLDALTDQSVLSAADRRLGKDQVDSALTARVDRMRGTEAALAAAQSENLAALRDDDVSALEFRIGLLAACFLLAVGVSTAVARTLTRPLAVLRLGAARLAAAPEAEEPVRYTGRDDEFAQVVRSLNSLHGKLVDLGARSEQLTGDRTHLVGQRENLDAQRRTLVAKNNQLVAEHEQLAVRAEDATAELAELRSTVHSSFVKLSLRTLGVVERQLAVIESLEEREQDPDRLATLFKLDHMATVMRRHGENLLVLAGTDHGVAHTGPVPLVDVLRASISEIERYERVTLQALPPHSQVAGFAADDLSHLLAELLENATSFSPPDAHVQLSGWFLESGEIMLSVQDEGIGMAPDRLTDLNARLSDPATYTPVGDGEGLGLQVAALLAARHGVRIQLRGQEQGGSTAVVILPAALLAAEPPAVPTDTETPHPLPGSAAEANSNDLPGRQTRPERTASIAVPEPEPVPEPVPEPEPGPDPEPEPASARVPAPAPQPAPAPDAEPHVDPLIAAAEKAIEVAHAQADKQADKAEQAETDGTRSPVREDAPQADHPTREIRLPKPTPAPDPVPAAPDPAPAPEPTAPRLTDKGLPKRTPKVVKPTTDATPRRSGGVDADALRRRLGGFHQGAKDGRRDVEAEIANSGNNVDQGVGAEAGEPQARTEADTDRTRTDRTRTDRTRTDRTNRTDTEGDTVEEARS